MQAVSAVVWRSPVVGVACWPAVYDGGIATLIDVSGHIPGLEGAGRLRDKQADKQMTWSQLLFSSVAVVCWRGAMPWSAAAV
jgi:hypothetical protein